MQKGILMQTEEPSDKSLSDLMKEVAREAKRKALISEKELAEKINNLIEKASQKN